MILVSGQLPMHATVSGFLIFWLPWIAVDLAASTLLCRGRATLWDGTYSLLLTLEILARAARVVVSPTPATFKVTPKDGIDDGGWQALRQLHLVVGIAFVLSSALVLRALTALGVGPLPHMGAVPLAIGMALGLWELVLVVATLGKVGVLAKLRHHYRTPTDMAAFIGDDMVRMVDLTPTGAGFLGPRKLALGQRVLLVADLPMADRRPRSTRLQLTVAPCRPDAKVRPRLGGSAVRSSPDRRRPRHPRGILPHFRSAVPPHRERAHGRRDLRPVPHVSAGGHSGVTDRPGGATPVRSGTESRTGS